MTYYSRNREKLLAWQKEYTIKNKEKINLTARLKRKELSKIHLQEWLKQQSGKRTIRTV